MSITFACESCGKSFTVDDKFAGKKGKCKQCGEVMPIPRASMSRPAVLEVSPSRRPSQPAPRQTARPSREDVFGFDEPPPSQPLPAGVEEVEEWLPVAQRFKPRSAGLYGGFSPPRKKKKGSGGDGVGLVVKIALGIVLGFGILIGAGVALTVLLGLLARTTNEAILQERVALNKQLATILSGVRDVPSAQAASQQANAKIRAIAANLRQLKHTKGLTADVDALNQQYQLPQEQATQLVIQEYAGFAPSPAPPRPSTRKPPSRNSISRRVPFPARPGPNPRRCPSPRRPCRRPTFRDSHLA